MVVHYVLAEDRKEVKNPKVIMCARPEDAISSAIEERIFISLVVVGEPFGF